MGALHQCRKKEYTKELIYALELGIKDDISAAPISILYHTPRVGCEPAGRLRYVLEESRSYSI